MSWPRHALAVLALAAVALVASSAAHPWGQTGHRVVGHIAENHLSPEAAAAVAELIGPDSLAEVSTWADRIRSDPDWEHASAWHYVNIPDGASYAAAEKNPRGDLVQALRRFEETLRAADGDREDKVEALKFLVHLVGDAHQPLHVGRPGDRGGTEVEVRWFGRPTDLHAVWDHHMIDSTRLSFSEFASFIDDAPARDVARWQQSEPLAWIRESMALRGRVYDIGDGRLGYRYWDRHRDLLERRLLQAGVRVAGLLERIFGR